MMFKLKLLANAAVAIAFLNPLASQAGVTLYNSQANFLAAVPSSGKDTFDDLSAVSYPANLSRSAGVYSYQAHSDSGGFFPSPHDWLATNNAVSHILFDNFSGGAGVYGVGGFFFGTDIDGNEIAATISVDFSDGTTHSAGGSASQSSFFGIVSDSAIVSVRVVATQTDPANGQARPTWATANDLILGGPGQPVPEPATLALVGLAVAAAATSLRRRQS